MTTKIKRLSKHIDQMAYSKLTFHSPAFPYQLDFLIAYHAYLLFRRFRLHLDGDVYVTNGEKSAPYEYDRDGCANDV